MEPAELCLQPGDASSDGGVLLGQVGEGDQFAEALSRRLRDGFEVSATSVCAFEVAGERFIGLGDGL